MRLKNNPKAKDVIRNSEYCLKDLQSIKGHWNESFSNNKPINLEIGCGKGKFLTSLAKLYPDEFFLGLEQYESVLFAALKKIDEDNLSNLRFLCERAEYLSEFFAPGEIDKIYLNFSDPWPKKRHAKRRLTSERFLPIYNEILVSKGMIEIKTDNRNLYEFSLETLGKSPFFDILCHTDDLYSDSAMLSGNVPTEYEEKFHSKGEPITKIIAQKTQ